MAYSTDVATLLTDQLTKLTTLKRHQLAGQVANLDFWLGEIGHALAVIDGYPTRFSKMKRTESAHVAEFKIREHEEGLTYAPMPLKRVPDAEFREARRALCRAADGFLSRCVAEGLTDESTSRRACEDFGIRVDSDS
jgi:hypothetical protein